MLHPSPYLKAQLGMSSMSPVSLVLRLMMEINHETDGEGPRLRKARITLQFNVEPHCNRESHGKPWKNTKWP